MGNCIYRIDQKLHKEIIQQIGLRILKLISGIVGTVIFILFRPIPENVPLKMAVISVIFLCLFAIVFYSIYTRNTFRLFRIIDEISLDKGVVTIKLISINQFHRLRNYPIQYDINSNQFNLGTNPSNALSKILRDLSKDGYELTFDGHQFFLMASSEDKTQILSLIRNAS